MRKLTTVGLLLLVFVGLAMGQVTLSLPTQTAANGTALALPVQVTGFNHVGSFSLTITFDKNVLTYSGTANQPSFGIFNSTPVATANTNGSVSISWFNVSPALNIGSGTLLNLLFSYSTGSSALTFTNTTASSVTDSIGNNLTATFTNGGVSGLPTTITVGSVTSDPGDVYVPLTGANLKSLGSISLKIAYDTAKVTFVGLTNPALSFSVGASAGVVTMAWFSTTPYSLNSGKLSDLHFILKNDSTTLTVVGTSQVTDSVGNNLTITYVNGKIAKTPLPPVGLTLSTVRGVPGKDVSVPITATRMDNIGSISLRMTYDQTKLTFKQIANFPGAGFVTNASNGVLSFAWFGTTYLNIGTGKLMDLVFTYSGGSSAVGFNTAQSQVTDAVGNNLSLSFGSGVVNQDSVPHFTAIAPKTVVQNDSLGFVVLATDADAGDALTYSVGTLPSGSTFNATTKLFSWKPSYSVVPGVYNVWFYVADPIGAMDSTMAAITVTSGNRPPTFTAIPAMSVAQNDSLGFVVVATDPDAAQALTYSAGTLPSGSSFNAATQLFSWKTSFSVAPGVYNVWFYVADPIGAKDSTMAAITVTFVNQPPKFTAIPAKSVAQNDSLGFVVVATDPDTAQALTYTAGTLPSGAAFNATTRLFNWKPSYSVTPGVYNVWFYVADPAGAKDSAMAAITVMLTNRKPSFVNKLANVTTNEGVAVTFTYTATDPDAGQTLTFTLVSAPTGATLTSAGVFSYTPPATSARTNVITAVVSDGSLTDTAKATVTVNHKPVYVTRTPLTMTTASQNNIVAFVARAKDVDGFALQYTWKLNGAVVKGPGTDSTYSVRFTDAHGTVKKVVASWKTQANFTDSTTWDFTITDVEKDPYGIPTEFALGQNYPNPFNPSTTIRFDLPKEAPVTMEVYNVLGVRVRTLLTGETVSAGRHTMVWDGRDDNGNVAPSGVYLYRISASDFHASKKMTLLK